MATWWEETAPLVDDAEPPSSGGGVAKRILGHKPAIPDDVYLESREPGFVDKIWDHVRSIGLPADQMRREVGAVDDLVRLAARGMTFGWADSVAGTLGGTGAEHEQERTEAASERRGALGVGAEMAGSAITLGGAAKHIPGASRALGITGRTATGRVAAGTTSSAGIGALDAAGRGEDPLTGAAVGAASSIFLGSAGETVGKGLARLSKREVLSDEGMKTLVTRNPTSDALDTAANDLYKKSEEAGVVVSQKTWHGVVESLREAAVEADFNIALHPKVTAALTHFNGMKGKQPTLKEIDQARRQLNSRNTDPDTARVLGEIRARLDEHLQGLKSTDIVAGNVKVGVDSLVDARRNWTAKSKLEVIEKAFRDAEDAASPFDDALRTEFRKLAKNKNFSKRWTREEQEAIRRVAGGEGITRLLKGLGGLQKAFFGTIGGSIGYGLGGLPGAVAGVVTAESMKAAARVGTKVRANDVRQIVGSKDPGIYKAGTLGRVLGLSGGLQARRELER